MYRCTYCTDLQDLRKFLEKANDNKYNIISVTQKHGYTVIYEDGRKYIV